jgi:hypothetical protein
VEFDPTKPEWELDLLRALAGTQIVIKEKYHGGDDPEIAWEVSVGSRLRLFYFMSRGETRDAARWRVIESVALDRLQEYLRGSGWTEIDTFIEQGIEFVMGRDPHGVIWGLAPCDDDPASRQDLIDRIMREEVTDRAVAIDYRDIVDPQRIQMTIDAAVD